MGFNSGFKGLNTVLKTQNRFTACDYLHYGYAALSDKDSQLLLCVVFGPHVQNSQDAVHLNFLNYCDFFFIFYAYTLKIWPRAAQYNLASRRHYAKDSDHIKDIIRAW